jgi:hypothetical protein
MTPREKPMRFQLYHSAAGYSVWASSPYAFSGRAQWESLNTKRRDVAKRRMGAALERLRERLIAANRRRDRVQTR